MLRNTTKSLHFINVKSSEFIPQIFNIFISDTWVCVLKGIKKEAFDSALVCRSQYSEIHERYQRHGAASVEINVSISLTSERKGSSN